jgi:ribosomal protein L37E
MSDRYDTCHSCGSQDLKKDHEVEDCRRNGDAYGIETITCNKCGWSISNRFDDAADVYYYETAYPVSASKPADSQNQFLTPEMEISFAKMAKIKIPRDAIYQSMTLQRIRKEDIEAFMIKYNVLS